MRTVYLQIKVHSRMSFAEKGFYRLIFAQQQLLS